MVLEFGYILLGLGEDTVRTRYNAPHVQSILGQCPSLWIRSVKVRKMCERERELSLQYLKLLAYSATTWWPLRHISFILFVYIFAFVLSVSAHLIETYAIYAARNIDDPVIDTVDLCTFQSRLSIQFSYGHRGW